MMQKYEFPITSDFCKLDHNDRTNYSMHVVLPSCIHLDPLTLLMYDVKCYQKLPCDLATEHCPDMI